MDEPTVNEPQVSEIIEADIVVETPDPTPIEPSSTETPASTETPVESPPPAPESAPDSTEDGASGVAPVEFPATPEANQPPATELAQDQPNDMFTIRSDETGDKVYLVREEKRYWVKNTETLTKLGFYLGKEKRLPFSELLAYPEGEPVDTTIPDAIMPWDRSEEEKKPDQPYQIWS